MTITDTLLTGVNKYFIKHSCEERTVVDIARYRLGDQKRYEVKICLNMCVCLWGYPLQWYINISCQVYYWFTFTDFLGAFAKFRKTAISFVLSVLPSICTEQLGSNWKNFEEIWYLILFLRKSMEKILVSFKSDKSNGHLYEYLVTSKTTCRWILRIGNISYQEWHGVISQKLLNKITTTMKAFNDTF
jgi:hypothetical protein